MKLKRSLFILLLLIVTGNAFAHALWIETSASGKVGQTQEIVIYYGEYAENERDSVAHWFSDIKEVKIWLISPDNKKTQLVTTVDATRLTADFTPVVSGNYTILADHPVKDVPRTTLYEFIASATVIVGNATTLNSIIQNTNSLSLAAISSYKVNQSVTVQALFKNIASKDVTFSVVSPTGWSKSFKADTNGNLTFTPIWPGVYYVEAFYTEKTSGEQNGKTYDSIWRGATYFITVHK